MKHYDAVVIGGGILGCMLTRNLRRWNIRTLLLEKEEDVCKGITRANSAIVYAGYDNKPGSLKAELTVRGNANMETLCQELEVPFSRCGSLLVTYDETSVPNLQKKLENGIHNGVPGIKLLTGGEADAMEPQLRKGVAAALYAPTTGTVNPWQLGIAAYENALQNGAEAKLNQEVIGITQAEGGFWVEAKEETFFSKMVFNCAGLWADKVQELAFPPSVWLELDSAEFFVMDDLVKKPQRVIFLQARSCGKGITAIPCTEGNLLLSGVRRPMDIPFATSVNGLEELGAAAKELLPDLDLNQIIRSFGAVRPNPSKENGESIHDFCIENPAPGFYSLIGIKTPGLTCANELGMHLAQKAAAWLAATVNDSFIPHRKAIPDIKNLSCKQLEQMIRQNPDYGEVICQCQNITKAQIIQAIARGAVSVEGVKRRVGTGSGRCQGDRCSWRIARILKQAGFDPQF